MKKRKETNASAKAADEVARITAGQLAGGQEYHGAPGSGQPDAFEEDRRQAEDPQALKSR